MQNLKFFFFKLFENAESVYFCVVGGMCVVGNGVSGEVDRRCGSGEGRGFIDKVFPAPLVWIKGDSRD